MNSDAVIVKNVSSKSIEIYDENKCQFTLEPGQIWEMKNIEVLKISWSDYGDYDQIGIQSDPVKTFNNLTDSTIISFNCHKTEVSITK